MSSRLQDRVRQARNPGLLAVIAGLAGRLALSAVLAPFRANFPNTDAAIAFADQAGAALAGSKLAGARLAARRR